MVKEPFNTTSKIEIDINVYFNPAIRLGICIYNDVDELLMDTKKKESALRPYFDDKKIKELYNDLW